jgi:ABC-type lipoprotein export system ATPase subunit
VTHDEHLAQRCQRQIVISDGRIVPEIDAHGIQGEDPIPRVSQHSEGNG